VVFKGLIAAVTAVALSATPAIAAANGAASAARAAVVAPAGESVEGSELRGRRGGFIIPLLVLIAILLGILAALKDNDKELPRSP
jgi:hypothetical protein